MVKVTDKEKAAGELAIRKMCCKAITAYGETDQISVYALDGSRFDGEEQMYSIRGVLGDIDMLAFGQVEDILVSLYDQSYNGDVESND